MTNKIDLSRDALFHNRTESMSLEQLARFETMQRINHIINCALTDDRERSSGKCLNMTYTSFLTKLNNAFQATLRQEQVCDNIIIFDDFVRIADFSFAAIKEIVAKPSTRIEKAETKMLANKASNFGTKTMRWMSQRPGRTIEEKISPENKVLTSKTVFTTDTKENREFMYLYRIIYDAIISRFNDTNCKNCIVRECEYYNWVIKVQKIVALNLKIKNGELGDVKPVKQTFQNNKLMCDKNYKIVWDAVKMLSNVEEKIYEDYNSNLVNRLARLMYWLILGKMISLPGVMISDYAGSLQDSEGDLWFGGDDFGKGHRSDHILVMTIDGRLEAEYTLALVNEVVILTREADILFRFDANDYFAEQKKQIDWQYVAAYNTAVAMSVENTHEMENL